MNKMLFSRKLNCYNYLPVTGLDGLLFGQIRNSKKPPWFVVTSIVTGIVWPSV